MTTYFTEHRKDRLMQERVHDPYQSRGKPREPSMCPKCKAVFQGGRWQWIKSRPANAHEEMCQACQRIRDDYPAGLVSLKGEFVSTHKKQTLNLARNQEQAERALHPLHRILRIEERVDHLVISTTDIHLPKRIGEALHRAYKGELDLNYEKESCFVRVIWTST